MRKKTVPKERFMQESSAGAIFLKNLKSQYIVANNKTSEVLGMAPDQFIGKDDYQILSSKKEAKENIRVDRFVFRTGKPKEVTKHVTCADGKERWFHTIKIPQFNDEGNVIGLVGIVRDITGRKKMEAKQAEAAGTYRQKTIELEKAYKELEEERKSLESSYTELQTGKDEMVRSEKLAFTGRIAAGIAHEIRNPLANVYMSVQRLKKAFKPEDVTVKDIEMVTRNVERINFLITELLNCARPPKLNLRSRDVHRVVRSVLELSKNKIGTQGIKVTKRLTSKPSKMKIDRDQIERALSNIIINAIESMPKGGKLTIVTEINENIFVIKIQDTGKGIPEEDIIRIFDPFFSTKAGGVGLGLTLCYGIVVGHGGTIGVESKRRKGTTFTVSLPIR